ncbi:MAG: enoyl-CoA hydratase/isomerase family protein [Nannocystaceae bacterium]
MVAIVEQALAPGVWSWQLNRPEKRNAIRPDMLDWIRVRAGELAGEVVVVSGAGGRVFSAGFDLNALPQTPSETALGSPLPDAPLIAATAAMKDADAIFIAALDGPAIGAAAELVFCCDFQVAHPKVWFQVPAAALGVVYHPEGLRAFHARLGPAFARRLLLAGERLGAAELHQAGRLTHLVAPEEVGPRALELATGLAKASAGSTRAHARMLRALEHGNVSPELLQQHVDERRQAYARAEIGRARASLGLAKTSS